MRCVYLFKDSESLEVSQLEFKSAGRHVSNFIQVGQTVPSIQVGLNQVGNFRNDDQEKNFKWLPEHLHAKITEKSISKFRVNGTKDFVINVQEAALQVECLPYLSIKKIKPLRRKLNSTLIVQFTNYALIFKVNFIKKISESSDIGNSEELRSTAVFINKTHRIDLNLKTLEMKSQILYTEDATEVEALNVHSSKQGSSLSLLVKICIKKLPSRSHRYVHSDQSQRTILKCKLQDLL